MESWSYQLMFTISTLYFLWKVYENLGFRLQVYYLPYGNEGYRKDYCINIFQFSG